MAKVIGPAISLGASGSFGKALTFQKKGSGHAVYLKSHPGARAPYIVTPQHQSQENRIGYIVAWWQALTPAQKTQWDEDAKDAGMVGTGYHYFMKTYGGKTSPWPNGFFHRKKITINYTKVSGAQVNFPMLFSVIDADLAVCQSSGNDILFTSSDARTKLDHEIERFVVASGTLIAWVRIPSLSASVNTEIYIYYDQPSASSQQNPTGVWNSGFKAVYHMNDLTTSTIKDSTGLTTASKTSANNPIEADAKIGKGQLANGNDRITASQTQPNTAFSVSFWLYVDASQTGSPVPFTKMVNYNADGIYFTTYYNTSANILVCMVNRDSGLYGRSITGLGEGAYYFCGISFNPSTLALRVFKNGTYQGQTIVPGGPAQLNAAIRIMAGTSAEYLKGLVDEVQWSAETLSDGWFLTNYNTQNSPSTFFSVGAKE